MWYLLCITKVNCLSIVNVRFDVTDANRCQPNPCRNGGQCVGIQSTYTCLCQSGYAGRNCQHGNPSLFVIQLRVFLRSPDNYVLPVSVFNSQTDLSKGRSVLRQKYGVMQICSANIGFAVEDRYVTKSYEKANVMELHACVRCFLRKDGTLIALKTLIKKTPKLITVALSNDYQVVDACNRPTCTSVADHNW